MTRCVVNAVVESGVCAILSKGWSDRGSKAKGETSGDSEGADGVKYPDEILSVPALPLTSLSKLTSAQLDRLDRSLMALPTNRCGLSPWRSRD